MQGGYVFSFICILLAMEMVLTKAAVGVPLRMPKYLQVFGLLVLYQIFSAIYVSDVFIKLGAIKYFYSDEYVRAFLAFFILENTHFSSKSLRFVTFIILPLLVLASAVSVYQISDPFFFTDLDVFLSDEADSIEKVRRLLRDGSPTALSKLDNAGTRFLVQGYRNSIYSWVHTTSVGLDALAIFSLALGLKHYSKAKKAVIWIASALISFLCSYRWVMLNFFVISSQLVITKKGVIVNTLKYTVLVVALLIGFYYLAPVLGLDIQKFIEERLLSESANTRLYAFEVFGKVFPNNPIWGTATVDTDDMKRLIRGRTGQIHVGYLKFLYYHGLVGMMIYLVFMAFLFRLLYVKARQTQYWGSFFAVLAVPVANLTLVDMSFDHHGIYLAMIFARYINKDHTFE
jgi:hypothetical protein